MGSGTRQIEVTDQPAGKRCCRSHRALSESNARHAVRSRTVRSGAVEGRERKNGTRTGVSETEDRIRAGKAKDERRTRKAALCRANHGNADNPRRFPGGKSQDPSPPDSTPGSIDEVELGTRKTCQR